MTIMKGMLINMLLEEGVLKFGEFKLKSGKTSPYFFNIGNIDSGKDLRYLAQSYTDIIDECFGDAYDVLYGPAYKGIPLVSVITTLTDGDKRFVYNRKKAKNHGETGSIVGTLKDGDRVIIVDDVITTGGTKEEAVKILMNSAKDIKIVGVVICFDRLELLDVNANKTASDVFAEKFNTRVVSILTIKDIIETLPDQKVKEQTDQRLQLENHLFKYGKREGLDKGS